MFPTLAALALTMSIAALILSAIALKHSKEGGASTPSPSGANGVPASDLRRPSSKTTPGVYRPTQEALDRAEARRNNLKRLAASRNPVASIQEVDEVG